jgi:hypothetical protein
LANSTAHHNFNMYRHSAAGAGGAGYNITGGSERRNSSLGAATAGTDEGGSTSGGNGGQKLRVTGGAKAAKKNLQLAQQQFLPTKMTRQAVMLA